MSFKATDESVFFFFSIYFDIFYYLIYYSFVLYFQFVFFLINTSTHLENNERENAFWNDV